MGGRGEKGKEREWLRRGERRGTGREYRISKAELYTQPPQRLVPVTADKLRHAVLGEAGLELCALVVIVNWKDSRVVWEIGLWA